MSPTPASKSRGIARSRKNIGRPRRSRIAASTSRRRTTGSGLAVVPTTTSASGSSAARRSQGTTRPPTLRASSSDALRAAVGDPQVRDARGPGLLDEQGARVARSENEHRPLGHVAEDLRRQLEADRRNRKRVARDLGLRAHALARREGALEHAMEHRTRRPGFPRQAQRRPHLAEHLALAEGHRVEARRHVKQVPGRLGALAVEAARRGFAGVETAPLGDQTRQRLVRALSVGDAVDLAAVAGRDHDALGHEARDADALEHLADLVGGERDALAHRQRRRAEVPAEQHEARLAGVRHRKLCSRLK